MAVSTTDTLLQALQALYHHPVAETRKAADLWLEQFQQTPEAWQVQTNPKGISRKMLLPLFVVYVSFIDKMPLICLKNLWLHTKIPQLGN